MRWTYLDNTGIGANDRLRQTLTGLIDDEESARRRSRTKAFDDGGRVGYRLKGNGTYAAAGWPLHT